MIRRSNGVEKGERIGEEVNLLAVFCRLLLLCPLMKDVTDETVFSVVFTFTVLEEAVRSVENFEFLLFLEKENVNPIWFNFHFNTSKTAIYYFKIY